REPFTHAASGKGVSIDCLRRFKENWTVFFFQAEDGIRGKLVTGVQTCALPISLAGAPGAASAQDSSPARFIHRTRLDNGLEVITVANNTVPLATVLVAVRNGAFTQDSADQGMAHLYEHLLFRSYGGGRPDAFGLEVSRLNGRYNGATSEEVVYYHVAV